MKGKINSFTTYLKAIMLFISMGLCVVALAQQRGKNLVPNPSFEKHKNNPKGINIAPPWINIGSAEFFFEAKKGDTPDSKDKSKYKGAHTGTCYAGLRFQPEYKEYIYVELTQPLEKDKTYQFKMFVRLLEASTVAVRQLGVYFSDDAFKLGMTFDKDGLIDSTYKKGISGTLNWLPIQGSYVAHGGERFIIIGNFSTNEEDDFVRKNKWGFFEFKEAFYFIDDISVRKIITSVDSMCSTKISGNDILYALPDSFKTGQTIEIKNIQFETGSIQFKNASYKMLNELAHVLNDHPFMEVKINVRVENQSSEKISRKLSVARAKAVCDYLQAQDVLNPMTSEGLGAPRLLLPDSTDENRAQNRRVELVIIKE